MNTRSDAVAESSLESRTLAAATFSKTRPLYWSIRRELWENRAVYLAPLGVAAVILFGFLISLITLPERMRAALAAAPTQQHKALQEPYDLAAVLIMGAAFVVGLFYCIEALQGERRDRSILFWKSLPVSDVTTVLSKASIPFVILPLLTCAIVAVTHFIMLLLSSAVMVVNGMSPAVLWQQVSPVRMTLMLLYHGITVHMFWYAPIYAYLLLVSAWARRAAFVWAALPIFALWIIEKLAFGTTHVMKILMERLAGGSEAMTQPGSLPIDSLTHITPGRLLSDPGLWVGLVLTVIFLWAAVRLRRSRGPI
jgi:ABC-2 type transport system permease protein